MSSVLTSSFNLAVKDVCICAIPAFSLRAVACSFTDAALACISSAI
jgi:hypothetical protein